MVNVCSYLYIIACFQLIPILLLCAVDISWIAFCSIKIFLKADIGL